MLQIGYVGSQGHRLLASHDLNPSNPQTCLDMISISNINANDVTSFGTPTVCGPHRGRHPMERDRTQRLQLHMPNGQTVKGTGQTLQFVGLRPYSSPNCNAQTGVGCPADGIPVFTDIFAEDTVASSNYNSLQASLEKRFSKGLQFQAAYTLSKSIDDGSTFEETLNPYNPALSRALSLFNSAQRFVISYYWELPIARHQGLVGNLARRLGGFRHYSVPKWIPHPFEHRKR